MNGELVVWAGERTDFSQLQRRVTAGTGRDALARSHPAHYVVFDLLSAPPGLPLLDKPLAERRALLTSLLADASTQLTLSPQSTDVRQATEWLHTWTAAGIEGLMIKRLDSRYEPGKRGWQKYRAYHTTEANFVVFTHMVIRAAAPTSPAPFAASTLVRQLMALPYYVGQHQGRVRRR
ncbi:hypothetical protein AB0I37_25680 [Micromonospora purpureochromogenes]|uniref:ATP-dependent DNA ligase n=1 Tax=Micromonospora purpureochromogenes TaxID=47872 RepID=UPI003408DA37